MTNTGPSDGVTLGYRTDQEYRPRSAIQVKPAVFSAGLALLAAVVIAGATIGYYWLALPVIVGLAGVVPGILLGWALRSIFRRTRVRSMPVAITVGLLAGIAAIGLTYVGLYVLQVYDYRRAVLADADAADPDQAGLRTLVGNLAEQPFRFYDAFQLIPETGRGGFVGFLRSKRVMTLGRKPTHTLTFLVFNGLALTATACMLGVRQLRRPFCENCGAWFDEPRNAAVVPAEFAKELCETIEAGDPEMALALNREATGWDFHGACAVAQVYACPGCGQAYAEVVIKAPSVNETVLRLTRVSPEMVVALKAEPVQAVAEDAAAPDAIEADNVGARAVETATQAPKSDAL